MKGTAEDVIAKNSAQSSPVDLGEVDTKSGQDQDTNPASPIPSSASTDQVAGKSQCQKVTSPYRSEQIKETFDINEKQASPSKIPSSDSSSSENETDSVDSPTPQDPRLQKKSSRFPLTSSSVNIMKHRLLSQPMVGVATQGPSPSKRYIGMRLPSVSEPIEVVLKEGQPQIVEKVVSDGDSELLAVKRTAAEATALSEVESLVDKGKTAQSHGLQAQLAAEAINTVRVPGQLSVESGDTEDEATELRATGITSEKCLDANCRSLLQRWFSENPPAHFPTGHTVIGLSEGQMSSVVRSVAIETVSNTYGAMKDIMLKTANLRKIGEKKAKPSDKFRLKAKRPRSISSTSGDESGNAESSDGDSSGIVRTDGDDDDLDIYKDHGEEPRETQLFQKMTALLESFKPGNSQGVTNTPESPGGGNTSGGTSGQMDQTLRSVQIEARTESGVCATQNLCYKCGRKTRSKTDRPERPSRILREDHFRNLGWTKVFVTGPLDPANNKYCFYCRICNVNVSMYGKGASELARHYKRGSHFRRDQRWRYEYLQEIDPVKGTTRHLVRGITGRLLTESEVEREYPHFADAELVSLGPSFPYYHEFMSGGGPLASSETEMLRVQLSVFLKFVPSNGNLSFLRSFWDDVGTAVNHQTSFVGYDWGAERLSVSICMFYNFRSRSIAVYEFKLCFCVGLVTTVLASILPMLFCFSSSSTMSSSVV